jgi:hypothetical protein
MKLRAMLLAVMLAACGQNTGTAPTQGGGQPEPLNPFDVHIEIGRYGVMLNQVNSLTEAAEAATEPDVTDLANMSRELRESVWEYNLTRSRLCTKGAFVETTCGAPYEPVWIADTAAPTLEELKTRADAVGAEVMGLWNTICEDARTRETDEQARMYVCAIE